MRIPKYLRVSKKLFLYTLLMQLGFFAFGMVMVVIINAFFNEDMDYACMGTIMALCGILAGGFQQASGVNFRLTVLMGERRRYFLLWSPVVTALLTLQGWLTAFCLFHLETALYHALYPGYASDLPVELAFQWWAVAASAAALSIAALFFGAIYIKFGSKGAVTLWLVFCFGCMMLPQAIDKYQSGSRSLLAGVGRLLAALAAALTPAMWGAVGVVLLLCALAFSVWVYLRAEVRI